jgi:hypothetical protein
MSEINWAKKIGEKLIKDIEITIGNKVIYDSTKDKDKEEKMKLIKEIENFKQFGLYYYKKVYLNDSYEEIKFCYEHMKHQYNQIK